MPILKKKLRLRFLPFVYTQKELLLLKKYCETRLNTKASELYRLRNDEMDQYNKIIADFISTQKLQKKVKRLLALNNVRTRMNNIIFDRENAKKMFDTINNFVSNTEKGKKHQAFIKLNDTLPKGSKVNDLLQKASETMKKCEDKQDRRNDHIYCFIFGKYPALKEFEKKRV